MPNHAILELEEGALHVTVGARDGQTTRVLRSARLPAPDLGRDALAATLRTAVAELLQGVDGVHVVLGDRRMQHFRSTLPRLPAAELTAFVVREAARLTGVQSQAEVLAAPRLVRVLPDRGAVLATTALPRAVWEPLRQAFAAVGLRVLSLRSMEACLALAVHDRAGATALLECNAGRARFVACDDGCPVQVRRFLVGTAEDHPDALLAQLAMELPRTLDWLRETRNPLPEALVLGTRVRVPANGLEALRCEPLQEVVAGRVPVELAADAPVPSLGAVSLLARLCAGAPPPSLLDEPQLVLPLSRGYRASLAAAAAIAIAGCWSGVADTTSLLVVRAESRAAAEHAQRLAAAIASAASPAAPALETHDPRRDDALRTRRPTSRLLAELSNAAPAGMALERLEFASTERVVVAGVVEGASRHAALGALATFGQRLRALPYLERDGDDEVQEVDAGAHRYRFRLAFAWRKS